MLSPLQCQLPTPDNFSGSVESFMQVSPAFRRMKGFHFLYAFCLSLSVHLDKQVAIPGFFNSFWSSPCRNNFFHEERREFGDADLFQRFNNNESGEVCCLILRVWFWQVSFRFFIWRRHRCCIFFAGPVLCHPPTCVGNKLRGKPIRLGRDGDTGLVYLSWG